MAYGDVLTALADPTRRELYVSLRRGDRTVTELAALARISQPATSQHLRVLREAELVTETRDGTRRYYRASTAGLTQLRDFVESLWDAARGVCGRRPAPPRRAARKKTKNRRTSYLAADPPLRLGVMGSCRGIPPLHGRLRHLVAWPHALRRRPARAPHRRAVGGGFEWGEVRLWEPPRKVEFSWHPSREPRRPKT